MSEPSLFEYKIPKLLSVSPNCGVVSGGTFFNFTGENISIGNQRRIFIGDKTCEIKSGSQNEWIGCKIGDDHVVGDKIKIVLQIDGFNLTNSDKRINVDIVENPIIKNARQGFFSFEI